MKSAKEMFEKLGYKYTESDYCIQYSTNIDTTDYSEYHYVTFEKATITYTARLGFYDTFAIDMPTLKAINKQCEELGWLE